MTGIWLALVVGIAGGIGASSRMVLDGVATARIGIAYPIGTMIINVSGSFLLGLVTGLAATAVLPAPWAAIAGTGFLGGYTTFSTASFETVRLAQQGRWRAAILNGLGMLALCLAAAAAGWWLGGAIPGR